MTEASRVQAPEHKRLRQECKAYSPLVRALKELDASCMAKLCQTYSQAVNMLIRCGQSVGRVYLKPCLLAVKAGAARHC